MKLTEFLEKNQLLTKKEVMGLLQVSSAVFNRMIRSVTHIESLALDSIHEKQTLANNIYINGREYQDTFNYYHCMKVYFRNDVYYPLKRPVYGSASDVQVIQETKEHLFNLGLISSVDTNHLSDKFNIKFIVDKYEIKRPSKKLSMQEICELPSKLK